MLAEGGISRKPLSPWGSRAATGPGPYTSSVPRLGIGLSTESDPEEAAEKAAAAALEAAGAHRADAALVFATPGYGQGISDLARVATRTLGTEAVAGLTVHGVLARGIEVEGRFGVAALALADIEAVPFLFREPRKRPAEVGEEIAARLGGLATERDLVVLLPDPAACAGGNLLATLQAALSPAVLVGAGAAPRLGRGALQWAGGELGSGGLAGIVLRGEVPPQVAVTQACRPVTEAFTVTRTRGHWVLELDGRPALDVYREVARGPLAADLRRAAAVLLVALPVGEPEALGRGAFVVRNVVGFAEGPRAFAVAQAVKCGDRLALALRDAEAARADLKRMLERVSGSGSWGGLYFSCVARGGGFLGAPGLEAAYVQQTLGDTVGGMFGSCEIAPLGSGAELLTYTGVLALLGSAAAPLPY